MDHHICSRIHNGYDGREASREKSMTKEVKSALKYLRPGLVIEYPATMSLQYASFLESVRILVQYLDKQSKRRKK
jgi:hypothetical protein